MRVAQVSFYSDPAGRTPQQLLIDWPSLPDVADCARRGGARVSVVQACAHSQTLTRNGIDYYFLPFESGASAGRTNQAFVRAVRRIGPDVVHVHGLGFARDTAFLAANGPDAPIVLQDHATRLPRIWRRAAWRRGFSMASGIAFCSREQAIPFESAGLVHPGMKIYEIPESTSRFVPGDQAEARHATGVSGSPAILWVGHLNSNKDPLTVLDGVSAAAQFLQQLQLFCCFGDAPLMRSVQERISQDPWLQSRTHLLGRVPHETIEQLMRAADIFVLGSHVEGSGYSLMEALACGLPPVVTNIPSFRTLTADGAIGRLWPCGDSQELTQAIRSIADCRRAPLRTAVRHHFEQELSFEAVGRKLTSMYEDVVRRTRARARPGRDYDAPVPAEEQ